MLNRLKRPASGANARSNGSGSRARLTNKNPSHAAGVIGTLDRLRQAPPPPPRLAVAQPGAAVPAHVIEGARHAVLPPHHENALARDRPHDVSPGRVQLGGAPGAHPAPREDPLLLLAVDRGVDVVAARQRALSLLVGLRGFDEGGHDA